MPSFSASRGHDVGNHHLHHDHFATSSSSSLSLSSSGGKRQPKYSPNFSPEYQENEGGRRRRLSLMPPGAPPPPPPPVAPSSIRDSDNTSIIKHKINSRPLTGEEHEEYMTTKKVHVKTTKNTERRVQRQVVLEDGRVLEHEPPHVVVDTIEDTRTHEISHLEDRDLDTEIRAILKEPYRNAKKQVEHKRTEAKVNDESDDQGEIIDDSFQRTVNSKDVKENIVKTQVAQDLGLLSRRGVERILRGEESLKDVLERRQRRKQRRNEATALVDAKPVVKTYKADSRRKVVDTEDVRNISRRLKNGNVKTETIRTEKHEIFDDKAAPDDDDDSNSSTTTLSREVIERDGERYICVKRDEFTDFFRVPRDADPNNATAGEFFAHGPHVTTEEREIVTKRKDDIENWEEVGDDRIRQRRQRIRERLNPGESLERTDALTKKPLNFYKEEKTRKKETDRWLERHFGGSEWSLLTGSSLQTTTTATAAAASTTTARQRQMGSMRPEINSRCELSRDEKNLRRTQSFSSVPIAYNNPANEFGRGVGERIVRQTTTTINPGLEKVVYSSVTKSVAAAPRLHSSSRPEEKETHFRSTEHSNNINNNINSNNSTRLYRSALSLNNVDKSRDVKNSSRRDDKFLRGSTTSLIHTSREIPIILAPEPEEIDEESPARPPRKVKTEKEVSKKDLFFDLGGATSTSAGGNKLRTSTSYSELARTSMLNSNYFKGQHKPSNNNNSSNNNGELSKLSSIDDWKRRSYYFGETLDSGELLTDYDPIKQKTTHFGAETSHYADTGSRGERTPRTPDRRISPESSGESYLRVQSEPPFVKAAPPQPPPQPQPIREEIFHETARVRRVVPTLERKNSRQTRLVYRSESKREPKRSQSQQPLYRTELRRNKLYPSGKNFDDDDRDISGDYLDNDQDNNNNSQMFMDRNFSRSHHDLTTTTTSQQHRNYEKEEKKYTSYFAGDNDDYGPKRNNSNGYGNNTQSGPLANGYLGYRSVERSDGWDSPVAWMARSEKVSQPPRRSKSFMVGGTGGGSAGDSTSHSSSTASYGASRHLAEQSATLNSHYRSQQHLSGRGRNNPAGKSSEGLRHYYNEPNYVNTTTNHNSSSSKKNSAKERLGNEHGRNSPSSNIVYHYDYLADGRNIYGRPFSPGAVLKSGNRLEQGRKPEVRKSLFSKETSSHLSGGLFEKASKLTSKGTKGGKRDVYEFEKKVPMHSSSLEAQKFKTIIFLSGH